MKDSIRRIILYIIIVYLDKLGRDWGLKGEGLGVLWERLGVLWERVLTFLTICDIIIITKRSDVFMQKIVQKKADKKVYKTNEFIQKARFDLTLTQQKLILYAISKINKSSENFEKIKINLKEFQDICNVTHKDYTGLKQDLTDINKKCWWITIAREGKEIDCLVQWFSLIEIEKDSGIIRLEFHQNLKPYLLELSDRFYTSYELQNVLSFKSAYSIRLYELFKSLSNNESWFFTVDSLKEYLNCQEKYAVFKDFRKWVLDPSLKEINNYSDLVITYTTEKNGRKISRVIFSIAKKSDIKQQLEQQIKQLLNCDTEEEEEEKEWINPNLELYSSACNDEFTNDEIALLSVIIRPELLPTDQFGNSGAIYKYLLRKYLEMNCESQHTEIKNRFKYLKKMIEKDFEE